MANRAKGWNKLNRLNQKRVNKSRNQIEKIVDMDGNFLCFRLEPAEHLTYGWNWRNAQKQSARSVRMVKRPRARRKAG